MPTYPPRLHTIALRLLCLLILIVLFAPMLTPQPVAAAPSVHIIYAKPNAPAANSGNSWETARDLSTAMREAVAGDEIWAAAGVYLPLTSAAIPSFLLKS